MQPLPSIDYDATGGDLDAYYRGWGFGGPYYNLDQMGRVTRFTSIHLRLIITKSVVFYLMCLAWRKLNGI